jgi:predicted CoA-binding protein
MTSTDLDLDATAEHILRTYSTITVVGASKNPGKPAHDVLAQMQRHGWRIVPVNPSASSILGEDCYPDLAAVPAPVGLVVVFRPPAEAAQVAEQAIRAGATALWLQLEITSAEAKAAARAAGLFYVENRCLAVERARYQLEAPAA